MTPETVPPDPWADPLGAPLPSELERLERERLARERARGGTEAGGAMGSVGAQARTEREMVIPPASESMFPPSEQTLRDRRDEAAPARRTVRRRVPVRRVKRTLRHIDPLSVLKLSGFYWAVFLIVWLVIVAILYSIIEAAGFFDILEEVNQGFALEWKKVDITLGMVEKWAFLIGITFAVLTTIVNVFLAFLYNVAADLIGGLELTFVERDT